MRIFLVTVGVLAWVLSLGVFWIFAESGGALTVIAAGIYALLAIVAIGCERLLKTLEDIRDGRVAMSRSLNTSAVAAREISSEHRSAPA